MPSVRIQTLSGIDSSGDTNFESIQSETNLTVLGNASIGGTTTLYGPLSGTTGTFSTSVSTPSLISPSNITTVTGKLQTTGDLTCGGVFTSTGNATFNGYNNYFNGVLRVCTLGNVPSTVDPSTVSTCIIGGSGTPNSAIWYIGNGTGWNLVLASMSAGTGNGVHTFSDTGNYTSLGRITGNGVTIKTGFQIINETLYRQILAAGVSDITLNSANLSSNRSHSFEISISCVLNAILYAYRGYVVMRSYTVFALFPIIDTLTAIGVIVSIIANGSVGIKLRISNTSAYNGDFCISFIYNQAV
jgi:hypothetical protein